MPSSPKRLKKGTFTRELARSKRAFKAILPLNVHGTTSIPGLKSNPNTVLTGQGPSCGTSRTARASRRHKEEHGG